MPHTTVPAAWKAGGGVAAPVADRWLASFDDPALSALVDEALAYNADLQVAAARVEQAAGYVEVASGSLLPSVGVCGHGRRQVGRRRRPEGGLPERVPRARRLGPPALRAGRGRAAIRGRRGRLRLCAPVAGGDGGQGLVPGHRSGNAARDRAGFAAFVGGAAAARAGAVARRQRQRAGGGGGARQRRHLSRHAAAGRAGARAGAARARASRRALSGGGDRGGRAPLADATAGARGHAVGAARAPARRGRRRAPRRRGVRPGRRSAGGAVAAHQPDRRRQQRVERADSC